MGVFHHPSFAVHQQNNIECLMAAAAIVVRHRCFNVRPENVQTFVFHMTATVAAVNGCHFTRCSGIFFIGLVVPGAIIKVLDLKSSSSISQLSQQNQSIKIFSLSCPTRKHRTNSEKKKLFFHIHIIHISNRNIYSANHKTLYRLIDFTLNNEYMQKINGSDSVCHAISF